MDDNGEQDENLVDVAIFGRVAAEFQRLDRKTRIRLLNMLALYFDIGDHLPHRASRQAITSLPQPPTANSTEPAIGSFSEDRSLSPKAFMLGKRPQTDIERIACLAYYLTHYRQTQTFKTLELSKLNTEAAQVKIGNAAQAVDNAAKAGYLIQAAKGQKAISAVGELYVQALPDKTAAREAIAHAKPKRSRGSKRSKMTRDAEGVDDDNSQ